MRCRGEGHAVRDMQRGTAALAIKVAASFTQCLEKKVWEEVNRWARHDWQTPGR